MNISKNLLSLGLIAVISGISTAQTYTATAGTNGVTDIQSDYSMSTGDGASVSVDVPLEFELPKKIAIAVRPQGGNLPSSPLFDDITFTYGGTTLSRTLDLVVHPSIPTITLDSLGVVGGIYGNSEFSLTADSTDFVHESDSTSIIETSKHIRIGKKDSASGGDSVFYGSIADDWDPNTPSTFPATLNIDTADLLAEGNQFSWIYVIYPFIDTIDPTDRAGKYFSTATFTVTTL